MEDRIFVKLVVLASKLFCMGTSLVSVWEIPHPYLYSVHEHDLPCDTDKEGLSHVEHSILILFFYYFYTHLFGPRGYFYIPIFVMALKHLKQLQVLLLDEITVDLDVVTRMDLLDFFKEECEQVQDSVCYYRPCLPHCIA